MSKIVLIGGGGHCKSVADALMNSGKYDEIVITDPGLKAGSDILGCPVVGNDDLLPQLYKNGFTDAFITVGSIKDASLRKKLAQTVKEIGFSMPIIADPSAVISMYSDLGEGTFVGKNAVINADARIGNHCIVNTGAIIEHECSVGDFCHIAVGAILCGAVSVGNDSFIGSGANVIQGRTIGSHDIVGANSTVLKDVGDNARVYGLTRGE